MGEAIMSGLSKNPQTASNITVIEILESRRKYLEKTFPRAQIVEKMSDLKGFHIVILCVKPQYAEDVLKGMRFYVDQVVLSIMAGLTLKSLKRMLNNQTDLVVRVMPNTAAQVFKSVTVFCASETLSTEQKKECEYVMKCLGDVVIEVRDESYIDKSTGMVGSGPAWVFLILEAFIDTGVELGFTRAQSTRMTAALFDGSLELLKTNPAKTATALKNDVTSPGGTTAAGLAVLEREGLRNAIREGIFASYKKSLQLGKAKL